MPLTMRRIALIVVAVLFFERPTPSAEGGGDDVLDVAICGGEGEETVASGVKGQGHVNFRVDPSCAYAVDAELFGGQCGVQICLSAGGEDPSQVDFRIAVLPDGGVEVNGERLGVCDPAEGCRISLGWRPDVASATVQVAAADGAVCGALRVMAGPPEEVEITAAEVRALSVVRQ